MTLAVLAILAYAVMGIGAAVLVARRRRAPAIAPASLPDVTVVVAARNEEGAILACLEALARQDYPSDRIRFVIVDDGSTDATASIIHSFTQTDARFEYARAESDADAPPGKASALHAAISRSAGDVILTTDADCRPPAGWARSLASHFVEDEDLGAVGGVTRVATNGFFARLQAIDWTLLKGVAAGASMAGVPLTAMGNNMAIRRSAYDDVGGFPAVAESVTEDYALFKLLERSGWTVRLDPHPSSENETLPEPTFGGVFRQRRRWARGAMAASPAATAGYITIYAAHLLPLLLLPLHPIGALWLLAAKVFVDGIVVAAASRRGRSAGNLVLLPVYEIYLNAYLLVLPVTLAVVPDISWKGRDYR